MNQLFADVGAPQTETADGFAVFGAALSSSFEPVKRINNSISHPTTPASHPNSKKLLFSHKIYETHEYHSHQWPSSLCLALQVNDAAPVNEIDFCPFIHQHNVLPH